MLRPSSPAPARRSGAAVRAGAIWPYFIVFLLGCLAYASSAGMFFIKDDLALSRLTDPSGKPSVDALVSNFLWPASHAYPQIYRPVPILFGWFDLNVFGADPLGFRLCNVGFHALNGVLLAVFFNQITGFRRPATGLFAGALFALHPLHGEAVLWVTQRMVVLCATFSLLALIGLEAWLRHGRRAGLAVCVAASILASLCKEVTAALPAVMMVLAFLHPAESFRVRARRTLVIAALGALLAFSIFLLRKIIFDSWIGTYTNLTPAEYAREFKVFERLPRSLLDGLWAVNAAEATPTVRGAFGFTWLAFVAFAIARLVRRLHDPEIRRAAATMAVFGVASFLPSIQVFWITPTLFNARFLYQPLLGVIGLLLLGFTRPDGRRRLVALSAPAALAVLFALALPLNLRAFAGADVQIRTIRGAIEHEARKTADPPIVVAYRVPTEHHGVPTLDLSLAPAMRPPFTPAPGIDVVPLVTGLQPAWKTALPALRQMLASGRSVVHLVIGENPVRVSPLVGALDPAEGHSPPEVTAPADGAILAHPEEEPTFVFGSVDDAARYRVRFAGLGADVAFDLVPGTDLRRMGTRLLWTGGKLAEPWQGLGVYPSPVVIAWSVEAFDANDRSLGRSATRALVVLTPR